MEKFSQQERNGLYELTDEARAELKGNPYYNEDLAPTKISERTWNTYNVTALWISICICIPSFTMAAGLVVLGLSPWLAVLNITLGNLLVLIPMQLNSRAGTQYGIPFPVFSRMTFGMRGAHIPSLARGLAACGWNAFQCWIGGAALVAIFAVFVPAAAGSMQARVVGFFIFLVLCMWSTIYGAGALKKLKAFAGPILIVLTAGVFAWSLALALGGGFSFGDVMQASSDPDRIAANGGLWLIFAGGLTANIGFWGTMAINIPDFSRYAKSQKAQFRGQLYAVPLSMFACAFIGAFMAQATGLVLGRPFFDPTIILQHLGGNPFLIIIVASAVAFATLTTNIAANIVAPANGLTNLMPKKISYKMGVVITCVIAIAFQPWWLFTYAARLFSLFIGTYGGILAPLAAIFVADFYRVKQCRLNVMDLFQGEKGRYWYASGFNTKAIIAWSAGFILPTIGRIMAITAGGGVGSAHLIDNGFFRWVTANAYIFGFVVAYVVYMLIMDKGHPSFVSEAENKAITAKE